MYNFISLSFIHSYMNSENFGFGNDKTPSLLCNTDSFCNYGISIE